MIVPLEARVDYSAELSYADLLSEMLTDSFLNHSSGNISTLGASLKDEITSIQVLWYSNF